MPIAGHDLRYDLVLLGLFMISLYLLHRQMTIGWEKKYACDSFSIIRQLSKNGDVRISVFVFTVIGNHPVHLYINLLSY